MQREGDDIRSSRPRGVLEAIAAIAAVVLCMKLAAPIIAPTLMALVVVMLSLPLEEALRGRGLPTWVALAAVLLGMALLGALVGLTLQISADQLRERLPFYIERLAEERVLVVARLQASGAPSWTVDAVEQLDRGLLRAEAPTLLDGAARGVAEILAAAFLVVILLAGPLPVQAMHAREQRESGQAATALSQFVMDTCWEMVILTKYLSLSGIGVALWLWFLGVDFAPLWGLLVFVLGYIPSIGMLVAAIPALLQTYLQYGFGRTAAAGLGIFLITTALLLKSRTAMGQLLRLPIITAILSAIFWVWVLGPLGAILAWPLNSLALILLARSESTARITRLLGAGEIAPLRPKRHPGMQPPQRDRPAVRRRGRF